MAKRKKKRRRKPIQTRVMSTKAGWALKKVYKLKGKFDSRSFRIKKPRPDVLVTTGCPKGKWDDKHQVCRVGVQLHKTTKAISAKQAAKERKKRGVKVLYYDSAASATERRKAARPVVKVKKRKKVKVKAKKIKRVKNRKIKKARKKIAANYPLMVVTNPTKTQLKEATKAYKDWHLTGPTYVSSVKVPNRYPSTLVKLGSLESFNWKAPGGKKGRWSAKGKRLPIIAMNARGTAAYVLGGDFSSVPSGAKMTRINYRIPKPPRSNREKLGSQRWKHPFRKCPLIRKSKEGGFSLITRIKPEGFVG